MSDSDEMVGWLDGVLNTRAIRRGVTVLPAWQDCVWCVDVVMGQYGDVGQTVMGWTGRQRTLFLSSSYHLQKFADTDRLRVNSRPIRKDFFPDRHDFVPIVFTSSSCKQGLRQVFYNLCHCQNGHGWILVWILLYML